MSNFRKDQMDAREAFRDQKWVMRLVRLPEVVWNNDIAKIFSIFQLKLPKSDFDVYRHIDIEPFIRDAKNAFRTALIGHALNYVGIKLSFSENQDEGADSPNPVIKATIDPDKFDYAVETVRALVRNEDANKKYKSFLDNSNHPEAKHRRDELASGNMVKTVRDPQEDEQ